MLSLPYMLKMIGSAILIAVKLSLIIISLPSIKLCCDLSERANLSSCSALAFPRMALSFFVCPQAVKVKVNKVKKKIVFIVLICMLLCRLTIGANVECMQRAGVRGHFLIHRYCPCQRALNLQIALKPA